jgi:hypothetical protein
MTTGLSELPDFLRLTYFHGQMLAATDFQGEQAYFVEKLRLRNRCLHGYGVACGLRVSPVRSENECDSGPDEHQPRVTLHPGVALDRLGNEIVIRRDRPVELLPLLSAQDQDNFHEGHSIYLCVEYCERATRPTRGVYADSCGGAADCEYGWWQDSYRIRVTLDPPDNDGCADPCCEPCRDHDPCLLLARIDDVREGQQVPEEAIHLGVRRPLGRYWFTTITGANWQHGGHYTPEQAAEILGTHDEDGGLRVDFSKDVHARSLARGVVDIQVAEGGRGRHADTYFLDGRLEGLADEPFTRRLRWRQTSGETLQNGDRVLITVHTPFILDRCCRPVDGAHVGGRVPPLPGTYRVHPEPDFCTTPPSGAGPWTSGTGTGAGVFESWFFVRENHDSEQPGGGRDRSERPGREEEERR